MLFNCQNLDLTELPPLRDNVTYLACSNNRLTKLPEHLPETLTFLNCWNNRLTRLPEQLPNTLTDLRCNNNRLTRLPEHLPNSLKILTTNNNYLTKLPKHLPTNLRYFVRYRNQFLFNFCIILIWYNHNLDAWKNYKILVGFQKRSESAPERHRGLWVCSVDFQKRSESAPKESASQIFQKKKCTSTTYFNRDINRICNTY